jgi:PAS domain S-box-containing protein
VKFQARELQKYEEEFEASKTFLDDLINSTPDMVGVLDKENKWIKVNPAWEKIWGWKPEEMLGKRTEEQPFELPEMRKGAEERTKSRIERLSRGETTEEELVFLAKDGSERVGQFKEQWIKCKGKIVGRVVSMRDITELRKREEELKQQKEFSESLFRNLPIESTLSTAEGKRIDANLAFCRFFEKTREECVNAPMEEMYVKEDIPKLKEALEKCIELGDSSAECRMIRGDGAIRNYIIRFSALKPCLFPKLLRCFSCTLNSNWIRWY